MQRYELMILVSPDLAGKETEKALDFIRDKVKEGKGEIFKEDIWEYKDLAYKIKKHERAYFAVFYLKLEASSIKEIDREILIDQRFLRHMLISIPDEYYPGSKQISFDELKEKEEEIKKERKLKKSKEEESAKNKETKVEAKVEKKEEKKIEENIKKGEDAKREDKKEPKKEEVELIDENEIKTEEEKSKEAKKQSSEENKKDKKEVDKFKNLSDIDRELDKILNEYT